MSDEKKIDSMAAILIGFSSRVTSNFDANQDRETRRRFMFYISGIVFALNEMLNVSPDARYFMTTRALTIGVPNNFPFADCQIINFSENKAVEHIKYVGSGEWTNLERSITAQGVDDIQQYVLNDNYDVIDNFYYRFVA